MVFRTGVMGVNLIPCIKLDICQIIVVQQILMLPSRERKQFLSIIEMLSKGCSN